MNTNRALEQNCCLENDGKQFFFRVISVQTEEGNNIYPIFEAGAEMEPMDTGDVQIPRFENGDSVSLLLDLDNAELAFFKVCATL